MIDGSNEEHRERLSLGFGPEWVGISHADQVFLDHLFCTYPYWRNVVEFGTYTGATALLLGLIARCRGGHAWTIDNNPATQPNMPGGFHANILAGWLDNMTFLREDLTPNGKYNQRIISIIQSASPLLLIVDGGNKLMEIQQYAWSVPVGSGLCVHDCGLTHETGELTFEEADSTMARNGFVPVALNEAQRWRTGFRAYQKRGNS